MKHYLPVVAIVLAVFALVGCNLNEPQLYHNTTWISDYWYMEEGGADGGWGIAQESVTILSDSCLIDIWYGKCSSSEGTNATKFYCLFHRDSILMYQDSACTRPLYSSPGVGPHKFEHIQAYYLLRGKYIVNVLGMKLFKQ